MEKQLGFPNEILNKSKDERILYFKNILVDHPNLLASYRATMELVNHSRSGRLILVYGASGVGKSTLLKRIKTKIIEENFEEINANKGIIPVVDFEVGSEGSGKFNWKDFYRRFLKSLNEPLIDKKISSSQIFEKIPKEKKPYYLPATAQEQREALESALIYRKVKIALLDEAQHFLKIPRTRNPYDHMDALKSLANITGTIFILFGTFELMKFLDVNGQLTRRTSDIYFKRYDIRNKYDRERFQKTVVMFEDHLPFEEKVNLMDHIDFIYERSIGCIGILYDWLLLCVEICIEKDQKTISIDMLKRYAPTTKKSYEMADEAIKQEAMIKANHKGRAELRSILGIETSEINKSNLKQESSKKNSVGNRNPKRDQVGIEYE